jgi:hypothetical protein
MSAKAGLDCDSAYTPGMHRLLIGLLALACAAALPAQPAGAPGAGHLAYDIEAEFGSRRMHAGPYTQVVVHIQKSAAGTFSGQVVITGDSRGSAFGGRPEQQLKVTVPVAMDEGPGRKSVPISMPVPDNTWSLKIELQRDVADGDPEVLARTALEPEYFSDEQVHAAAVSSVRLGLLNESIGLRVETFAVHQLPDDWKALYAFPVILVNDDHLTRTQVEALRRYLVAGGTLMISPTGAASFNPDRLAGMLTGMEPAQRPRSRRLGEYGPLVQPVGLYRDPEDEDAFAPVVPDPGMTVTIWDSPGDMMNRPEAEGLYSIKSVGAGMLVLLHVNIAETPFSMDGEPTAALLNLFDFMRYDFDVGHQVAPRLLSDTGVSMALDIASKRIPAPQLIVLTLLVYVALAGVGMFGVARKIKRPELYPAVLVVCAVGSILLVFTLGEVFKRGGERVAVVHLVVSDNATDHQLVTARGCSYAVRDGVMTFEQPDEMLLLPARLESQRHIKRGMPFEMYRYNMKASGTERTLEALDIARWQNVYFATAATISEPDWKARVESLDGAWQVHNDSPYGMKACFVVTRELDNPRATHVFYVPALPAGESHTLRQGGALTKFSEEFLDAMRSELGDDAYRHYASALRLPVRTGRGLVIMPHPGDISQLVFAAGLMGPSDTFVVLSVVPEASGSAPLPGIRHVEQSQVLDTVIWAARGS